MFFKKNKIVWFFSSPNFRHMSSFVCRLRSDLFFFLSLFFFFSFKTYMRSAADGGLSTETAADKQTAVWGNGGAPSAYLSESWLALFEWLRRVNLGGWTALGSRHNFRFGNQIGSVPLLCWGAILGAAPVQPQSSYSVIFGTMRK